MKKPYKSNGDWLRQRRIEAGLSQWDVADGLGLKTAQSVSNIERGLTPVPLRKLRRYAKIIAVTPKDLFAQQSAAYLRQMSLKARL